MHIFVHTVFFTSIEYQVEQEAREHNGGNNADKMYDLANSVVQWQHGVLVDRKQYWRDNKE